jgi:Protein of unknown function (DUF1203)
MTTTQERFTIHAVPAATLADVRSTGRDVSGNAVVHLTASGGEPLRCCLRDAVPGEDLILFGYAPELPASPYREVGAIFAHAGACSGPTMTHEYPRAWRGRKQVLRAYDERGWIRAAVVHDGSEPDVAIGKLLADPEVVQIHSRNVAYGCFMFKVTSRS